MVLESHFHTVGKPFRVNIEQRSVCGKQGEGVAASFFSRGGQIGLRCGLEPGPPGDPGNGNRYCAEKPFVTAQPEVYLSGLSGHAGPPRGYRRLPGNPDSSIGRQCKGEWRIVLCKWCNSARNCTPLRIYRRRCKPLDLPSDPPGSTLSCRSKQNGTEAALAPQAAIPPPFRRSLPRFLDTHGGACYVLVLSRPRGISVTSPATSALLYPEGTFVDDMIVHRVLEEAYLLVINAGTREKDFHWVRDNVRGYACTARDVGDHYTQLAIQGPRAAEVLAKLADADLGGIRNYWFTRGTVCGLAYTLIARTGYTGEDGFEIYV